MPRTLLLLGLMLGVVADSGANEALGPPEDGADQLLEPVGLDVRHCGPPGFLNGARLRMSLDPCPGGRASREGAARLSRTP
jgi:hypothetical protein